MPSSPLNASDGVLRSSVKSAGQPIPNGIEIISLHISRSVGTVPTARLVVADGDMPSGAWPVADGKTFEPGSLISIAAGYGEDEQVVFEGIVVKLGTRIGSANDSRLVIDCCHRAKQMTIGHRNANHANRTDGEIIEDIVRSHGLDASVDATGRTHGGSTQYSCSDWDFILARAEVNGLLVIAEDEGQRVLVQEPRIASTPALCVSWGLDLLEFEADVDACSQLQSVQAAAWDPASQAVRHGTAQAPQALNAQGDLDSKTLAGVLGLDTFRLQTSAPLQQDELTAWSKAQQVKAGLSRIRGRMKFQGSGLARVGSLIEVTGVGSRFNGNVFVAAVDHEIADGNWFTTVEFGLAADRFGERPGAVAAAASGRLPAADGLQIGVVVQLEGDPAGEGRIQIQLPVLEARAPAVWARLSQFQASNGFGAFFLPEVGDEVVVGFFDRDPSHPVVLGSLYSSHNRPAYAPTAHNDTKALVTRCGHRIEFDEKDKVLTVTTSAKNRVVLSDQDRSVRLDDQNDNSVELHSGGITIETQKDLRITAKGTVSIQAVGAVSIGSQADVTCSGLNVLCEAQVGFSGKGSATAELSAAGQTTVKGAIVMIN